MNVNLRDRITLQSKVEATGPFQPLDEYEDYETIWAECKFLRGRNFYAAKAANVKTNVEFIIRHRTDIDETMRIKYNDKFYEIEGIIPLDSNMMYISLNAYELKHDM